MLDILTVEDPFGGLGILELQSIMCWPEDEARQNDFLTAAYKAQQIYYEKTPQEFRENQDVQEALAEWSQMIGGWEGIANSTPLHQINPEIDKRFKDGEIAGLVLALLYSWCQTPDPSPIHPSKNRICYLLEDLGHQIIGKSVSRKEVYKCWKTYGSVAHLWAAQYILQQFDGIQPDESGYGFSFPKRELPVFTYEGYLAMWKRLLVIADKLQDFGVHFMPVGGDECLLDPSNTCILNFPPDWEAEIPEMVFPEAFQESIRAYKS